MIIAIQVLLVVAILVIMGRLLISRSARTRAVWIILGVVFTIFAIAAVLFPDITNTIAHWVGIGRGADLLLYLLVVVVLVMIVQHSLQRQDDQRRFAELVREVALLRAAQEQMDGGEQVDDSEDAPDQ